MTGGDSIEAIFHRVFIKLAELDLAIANDARVRRSRAKILVNKIRHNDLFEELLAIYFNERNTGSLRRRSSIGDRTVSVHLKDCTNNVLPLVFKLKGRVG